MKETLSKKETPVIIGAGVIIGIIAVALVYFGNPANMGFCIACFLRDTTGALGFHSAAAVQYRRASPAGRCHRGYQSRGSSPGSIRPPLHAGHGETICAAFGKAPGLPAG